MSKHNLYLGQAGQSYVMSQFLKRGYNVALPQVDVGDDMFVVEDEVGLFHRIQVKTAQGKATKYGFATRFKVPFTQLSKLVSPELTYTFVSDFDGQWQPTLVISRRDLYTIYEMYNIGSLADNHLLLYFQFKADFSKVICSKISFLDYVENWEDFPIIQH